MPTSDADGANIHLVAHEAFSVVYHALLGNAPGQTARDCEEQEVHE